VKPTAAIQAFDLLALRKALGEMDIPTIWESSSPPAPVGCLYFRVEGSSGRIRLRDRGDCGLYVPTLPPTRISRWVAIPSSLRVVGSETDEEIAWQVLDATLEEALERLPEWEFDPDTRSWWLGEEEFPDPGKKNRKQVKRVKDEKGGK